MKTPKTLLTTLLSTTLVLAPISASADTLTIPNPTSKPIQLPKVDAKDLAKKIAKVGRTNAVAFAVDKLFEGIDWVMDPANNQAITKEVIKRDEQGYLTNCIYGGYTYNGNRVFPNIKILADTVAANVGTKQSQIIIQDNVFTITNSIYGRDYREYVACRGVKKTVSYDQIAQEILNNALLGHLDSIKFVQEVAEEKAKEEGQPIAPPANPPLNPPVVPPQPISPPNTDPTTAPPQPIAGNPTQPIIRKKSQAQCNKEWKDAERICKELIKQGDSNGVTGGYTDPFECSRGLVSQQCGGNKIEW